MTITLTDKHNQLSQFKRDMFNKTLTMFEWNNLPDTLPQVELEKLLQINGYAIIAECNGNLYAFNGGFSGQDAYKRPTTAIINNPALNFNEQLEIGKQCVVIKNDDMQQGLNKIFEKYGQLAIENMITMLMNDYNLRMPFTISSQDDSTTESARAFLQKIIDGSLGVIGENKLFQSLNVTPTNNNHGSTFADLYGYQQYILAELNNTIGLATNNNMKRERLTTNEIEVNKNASYPLVDNMLRNRQDAVAKINELFDADISVEFSSIWGGNNDTDDDSSIDVTDNDENVDDNVASDSVDDDINNNGGEVNVEPMGHDSGNLNVVSDDKSATGSNDEPEETTEPVNDPKQKSNEPTDETRENLNENTEKEINDESDNSEHGVDSTNENSTNKSSDDNDSNDNDDDKKKDSDHK